MKKIKLFLVVLLSWLSLSSVVIINASAVNWPLTEKSMIVSPEEIGKLSIKDNDDYTLYFTINIYSMNDSTIIDVTMIMFLGDLWINHSEDMDYLFSRSVMTPKNFTEETNYFEYFFYDADKFYPTFINNDNVNTIQINVTVTREERSRVAYYFAGFVTVIFAGMIIFVLTKKKDLLRERAEEIPQDVPLDSV